MARVTPTDRRSNDSGAEPASFPIVEWLLVLLTFAVFATVRSPIPGVNEPHYLTKARNFWDPSWCSRDPFLQSTNAHLVFYATIGLFTKFCSLEGSAWLGRLMGWLMLSSGWTALAARLIPYRWGALWSAWLFLLFAAIGNWSGEWVVGGIEAKVLSYGCGWWSLACALSGQKIRAAGWSGLAVSFHPVVGIWNTAAVVIALLIDDWRFWRVLRHLDWKSWALSGVAWIALAAPGLFPALAMVRAANPQEAYQADYIQVFHRLAHHLDPWHFSQIGYGWYAGLLAVSAGLYFMPGKSDRWNLAARYALAAVLIALAGVFIRAIPDIARELQAANWFPNAKETLQAWSNYRPKLAGLLKFYPFRLADVVVPWGCALLVVNAAAGFAGHTEDESGVAKEQPSSSQTRRRRLVWGVFAACFGVSLVLPAIDRNPSRLTPEQLAGWIDACRWVDRETPRDALCYSANDGWALRWYAHRADFLSFKDCPQDAPGIVAWNERFRQLSNWSRQSSIDGYSPNELRDLRRQTGIDYLIVRKFGPIQLEPVYRNTQYQVYRLPD